jgi:hypothetical protein
MRTAIKPPGTPGIIKDTEKTMIPEEGRHRIPLIRPLYLWALRWEGKKAATYEVTERRYAQPIPAPPPTQVPSGCEPSDPVVRSIERLGCFECIESSSDGRVYLPLKVDDGVVLDRE